MVLSFSCTGPWYIHKSSALMLLPCIEDVLNATTQLKGSWCLSGNVCFAPSDSFSLSVKEERKENKRRERRKGL